MSERPILFSAPMIRAIREGRKTQTRRVCKPANGESLSYVVNCGAGVFGDEEGDVRFRCPYGKPGDRLWVRETWHGCFMMDPESVSTITSCHTTGHRLGRIEHYAADGPPGHLAGKARPSIHMPRWASRILLEVTDVRVERLQEISDADAVAEGIERLDGPASCSPWKDYRSDQRFGFYSAPSASYRSLWDSINGPGSWDANPWVWAVAFRRLEADHG